MTDQPGTITPAGGRATITFMRQLSHPIEVVWAAITDPEIVQTWLASFAIDARVGGELLNHL